MFQNKIIKEITIIGFNLFLRFCSLVFPVKGNRVLFIRKSFSGSNITPVFDMIVSDFPSIDAKLIDYEGRNITAVYKSLKNFLLLLSSKIIITTHGSVFKTRKNITLELWHAFPTKRDGLFLGKNKNRIFLKYTDFHLSYSDFCTLLLNSRIGMPIERYVVLGAPRNDYLFKECEEDDYQKSFKKVILYAPTYREDNSASKSGSNLFDYRGFSLENFKKYLAEKNYLFIWKLHPNEETKIHSLVNSLDTSNIMLLTDNTLREMGKDLYQVLPLTDLLITDYSSIYADYLLLDKPMIFTPVDITSYSTERGLLLAPYDFWHPGPVCLSQNALCEEINKCLNDQTYYHKKRVQLKNLFHTFQNGSSSERAINFIQTKLENKPK